MNLLFVDGPEYRAAIDRASNENPVDADRKCPLLPGHPPYVFYTSGSTGRPKGVLVPHAGLMNYVLWGIREYGAERGSGSPVHSSIAFDLTLTSIFPVLLAGRPVVLAVGERNDVETLSDVLLARGDFGPIKLTPSHMEVLNANMAPHELKGRAHTMVVGADSLKYETLGAWRDTWPETRLINEYGPTETVVGCSFYHIRPEDPKSGGVPIGRPISNIQMYVLDPDLGPAPFGVPGELYIAGIGVARGYLKKPGLTSHRFVADPYGPPGSRMYRSGDLARRRPDGELEFLGRIDFQLKIRGYRIEPGEIEALLRADERVTDALVLVREQAGDKQLFGYVTARPLESGQAEAQSSQIDRWRQLYESTYEESGNAGDFNLAGWSSSYTGAAVPEDEMRIWVEETVARIRELRPRRVLEIGCGTGLLLTRLALDCQTCIGVDFSKEVLAGLGAYLEQRPDMAHVELRHGLAHELSFLPDDSVDTVILNSVVQYFPDVDYLLQVLVEAERVTSPGGHIFIGDVRNLSLLDAYHTSVQLHRATVEQTDSMSLQDLRQRIEPARRNEEELLLDAALFPELARRCQKLGRAEVALKAGAYDNELSRFRYDVTLTVGPKEKLASPPHRLAWDEAGKWREELRSMPAANPQSTVMVRGIRDARAARSVEAVRILQEGREGVANPKGLRETAARAHGEDPNAVMQLARSLGATLRWEGFGADGIYSAVFNPQWESEQDAGPAPRGYYRRYANTPAQTAGAVELGAKLLEYLRQNLPAYMTPAAVMVLPAWPLARSGKVDREALPVPMQQSKDSYRSPRTPQEDMLCGMFGEVLGLTRVGIDDNFFSLGGHSLLATRLVSQVRSVLGVELRIRTLFEAPTVAELVRKLDVKTAPESAFEQVLPLRARGSHPPLFCAHPAGGLSWCYAGFMRELNSAQPIYGLQAPAVMGDIPFPDSVHTMAVEYAETMRRVQPVGPYYLLGWSFGGILAHEIACRLQDLGERVGLLIIMDTFPAIEGHEVPLETEEEAVRQLAGIVGIDLSGLDAEGRTVDFATVFEAASRAGHVPADFNEKVARRTLQMMLHNAGLKQTFRSGRFDGDILLFFATKKEGEHSLPDTWRPHVTGKIEVHTIDCKHFEMTDPGPMREIGAVLEQRLKLANER